MLRRSNLGSLRGWPTFTLWQSLASRSLAASDSSAWSAVAAWLRGVIRVADVGPVRRWVVSVVWLSRVVYQIR